MCWKPKAIRDTIDHLIRAAFMSCWDVGRSLGYLYALVRIDTIILIINNFCKLMNLFEIGP